MTEVFSLACPAIFCYVMIYMFSFQPGGAHGRWLNRFGSESSLCDTGFHETAYQLFQMVDEDSDSDKLVSLVPAEFKENVITIDIING